LAIKFREIKYPISSQEKITEGDKREVDLEEWHRRKEEIN